MARKASKPAKPPEPAPRTIAWLRAEQAPLVAAVAEAAGLEIVGAGAPGKAQSGAAASALKTKALDDLRAVLASGEADLVWIASPGDFGQAGTDSRAVAAAQSRKVKVATLEPIPVSALDLASGGWTAQTGTGGRLIDAVHFCPLNRLSAPFREATEVLQSFGHVRAVMVEAWCAPEEGSLGARLFSALDLVHWLLGEPEAIDAAYVSPSHGNGFSPQPAETLRDLHGEITANLRFADGRIAGLIASDHAGRWNRTATLVGPAGRLRVFDDGFEWIGPDGDKVDQSRQRSRGEAPGPHAVVAIADQLKRLLDPSIPDAGPTDYASILAIGQAALLSARTGQGESPGTIRRMAGNP
jgi:predicted dehydrogenase